MIFYTKSGNPAQFHAAALKSKFHAQFRDRGILEGLRFICLLQQGTVSRNDIKFTNCLAIIVKRLRSVSNVNFFWENNPQPYIGNN